MIQKIIPVLPALNIKETIMFYENKLGFTAYNKGGYVVMKRDEAEIHFFLCTDKHLCENSRCFIKVSDVECLYSELSAADIINLKGQLKDAPGGVKEFCVKDNNGNLLYFGEEKNN